MLEVIHSHHFLLSRMIWYTVGFNGFFLFIYFFIYLFFSIYYFGLFLFVYLFWYTVELSIIISYLKLKLPMNDT
jgi:hypothetical protein